jgi:hypothetical protein
MKRSIEFLGTVALCITATACTILPMSKDDPSGTVAPEGETAAQDSAPDDAVAEDRSDSGLPLPGAPEEAGRREQLTCFTGNRNRHARIGVELMNDQVAYFAYYSKSRPRTCSLEAGRDDSYSRWADDGAYSTVTLVDRKGKLQIEHMDGAYRFAFFDVDRGRYCGMDGKINGSLTVMRGKGSCKTQGVMDGHAQ